MPSTHIPPIMINETRLLERFLTLAKINAPSKNERAMAEYLMPLLTALGFEIQFDQAHHEFGGECGNLIAYWPGVDESAEPLFLSTHMDTVLPTENLQPRIIEDVIYSDHTTILGADDRAALAAYIEAIEVIQENHYACGPIEFILTVNEQKGLVGSSYMDYGLIRSRSGYIFDSSGDVGQIILQGPFSSRIHCVVKGHAAHIGLDSDKGINAFVIASEAILNMPLGKIDDDTLANIGVITGGELSSIIPGQVDFVGEVRSFSQHKLNHQLEVMKAVVLAAAEKHHGHADVFYEKKYLGFNIKEDAWLAENARIACGLIDVQGYFTRTLGGADTNNLNEHGLSCLTLGNGFRDIHTVNEHISIKNLNDTGRYTIALILNWYANQ